MWTGTASGDSCDPCTDIDRDGFGDPGFPDNECDIDNCPEIPNPDQTDADDDGYGLACDCDDTEAAVNPGHAEQNDGLDNDCDDLVDEGSVDASFCCDGADPPDCTRLFCWPAQEGATMYQVLRAEDRQMSLGCESSFTAQTAWNDPAEPDAAEVYYYLHRPAEPHPGSWGAQTPSPFERDPVCLP